MSDPIPMPQPADDPLKKGREFLDPHWSKYEPLIEAAEKYAATAPRVHRREGRIQGERTC